MCLFFSFTSSILACSSTLADFYNRYPKPGTPNPTVTVHTFSLSSLSSSSSASTTTQRLTWPGEFPLPDRIITEIGWVADDALLVKEIDRAAKDGNVVLFQFGDQRGTEVQGEIVRRLGKDGEEGDDGWIDHASAPPPFILSKRTNLVQNSSFFFSFFYRARTSFPLKG